MNNKFELTAMAVKHAEEALATLKEFTDTQYKVKGATMLDQIIDYITHTLENVDYMCCGCKSYHLSLSNMRDYFTFYIYDGGAISSGYPAFTITKDGKVKHKIELAEWMMLRLVDEWAAFKKELDIAIRFTLNERTKSINNQLAHIGYVNEKLEKWEV